MIRDSEGARGIDAAPHAAKMAAIEQVAYSYCNSNLVTYGDVR